MGETMDKRKRLDALKDMATKYIKEALPIGEFYVVAKAKGFSDSVIFKVLDQVRQELNIRKIS